jgi:hypothetical protein
VVARGGVGEQGVDDGEHRIAGRDQGFLAREAPELGEALERAKDAGLPHVILDGTVIEADRCKEPAISVKGEVIDLWYSGKAHTHGGNSQAVLAPDGFRCGSRTWSRARSTTSPPPAST